MVFVTGGTGFLGSHLIYKLLSNGQKVRALKRENSDFTLISNVFSYYEKNYQEYLDKIEWVEGDLLDIFSLEEVLENVTDVFHAGALVSFHPTDRKELMRVNINGTANLVNISLEKKIRKYCHVSSIAALGRAEADKVISEEILWKSSRQNSNYAISKYGAEREVWRGIEEGLNAVIVSPSVILGPGELNSGIGSMISMVQKGFKFYTLGTNGFVDVRDVVKTMIELMNSNVNGERFIVSSENHTYKEIFSFIAEFLDKPAPRYRAAPWMSEIAWRIEHIKKLVTGSKPLITKETTRTAINTYLYSNEKIVEKLDFGFLPIKQSIKDSCELYIKKMN